MNGIPQHVGIIMDGNGRWATSRGLPRTEGHRRGAMAVKKILRAAERIGVKYLTLYAFSSENFSRPKQEVMFLMNLFERFVGKYGNKLIEKKIRFRTIGNLEKLPISLQEIIKKIKRSTETFEDYNLTIALNYGSIDEIVYAVNKMLSSERTENFVTWSTIKENLYTSDLPDLDLIIRTSGEKRLSNFLLLQSAYAELYFTDILWPDFDENAFIDAIKDFQQRKRRMGNINDEKNI